jgi:transcriptional regulator of NAD metabolism
MERTDVHDFMRELSRKRANTVKKETDANGK